MSRPITITLAAAASALALLMVGDVAHAQTRLYGVAPAQSVRPESYRVRQHNAAKYRSIRYHAPRHDGRDVPGPLIITPGQILDDTGGRHDVASATVTTRPRMEHWVLRPVPRPHALTSYQPAFDGSDESDPGDTAADAPPAPPGELYEPDNEIEPGGDDPVVHYLLDDCYTRRRLGPYPDVGNYDDGYGRYVRSGQYATSYGAQGFLYGTPGNTWWDFYGYPYVGARMSWALPWWGWGWGWGGYGLGFPWGGYGLYGYGGYGAYWPRGYGYYGFYRPYGFYGYGGGFYRGWGRFGYRGSYHW